MDNESTLEIDEKYGTKYWVNAEGRLHRLDGPAVEWLNGDKQWWKKGNLHRIDGPAIERSDGYKYWWKNGINFPYKDTFFESLTEAEKEIALFSEDFLNG